MLPRDIQIGLSDKMIVPILLYGCEVWCPNMTNLASKLQLRFYKYIFKLNKSTPSRMVYGELGQFPLEIQAKSRMLNFGFKLVDNKNIDTFSSSMYRFLFEMFENGNYQCCYLRTIRDTLNEIGLSGFWINQRQISCSDTWFKLTVNQNLKDQYTQHRLSDVDTSEYFYNYRLYKNVLAPEHYLTCLPERLLLTFMHFRTLNHT